MTKQWPTWRRAGGIVLAVVLVAGGLNYVGVLGFSGHSGPPVMRAVAVVRELKGSGVNGVVNFDRVPEGIRVTADLHGLKPGLHAFHVHAHGDERCNDGMCTGDHFNPTGEPHGDRTSPRRHVGDFGNLEANESGDAHLEFVDKGLALSGRHGIVGRAVIVHADPDDGVSQPSGNAGARIGCGVIGIASDRDA